MFAQLVATNCACIISYNLVFVKSFLKENYSPKIFKKGNSVGDGFPVPLEHAPYGTHGQTLK